MRRVAATRVYKSEKEFYKNHVVELFNSHVANIYALQGEVAMTEWLGGVIILLHTDELLKDGMPKNVKTISELFTHASQLPQTHLLYGYHITNVDILSETLSSASSITYIECY